MVSQTQPTLPSSCLQVLQTHTAPINTLAFSHSGGTFILTGSSDRQIHLSRTEPSSSKTTSTTSAITNEPSASGNIPTAPVITTPIQRYTSHGYPVLSIAVTQPNNHFASSSADRSGPFLWDIQTPDTTLRRFGGNSPSPHTSRITCVSFAADDSILASGSDDRSIRLWDMKSRDARPLMILEEAKDGISALVTRDTEIISGSTDGRLRSYDARMGRCTVDVQPGPVTSLDLSRDGRAILVGCLDGKIRYMDRENGNCLRTFPPDAKLGGDEGYVNKSLRLQSCLAQNESLVLSGSEADGRVRAWDVLSGKQIGSVEVSSAGKVLSVVKWREGSEIENRRGVWAAGGVDGVVKVYG
ncbi:hypothetical protein H2198_001840 [Neophaeococcomyces mojaviensis]|uniref:Uncharacterized protein n=1 Tax=Neophaeococcomyces mojaviensis TaxID=3383035 RepID=A0ACC3AGD7_9EURO|nr:hypothetical protein H2198_001840 [Knufia sp. JES_112]